MDNRSPLHWSALLLGLFAATWLLGSVLPGLIFLVPLLAIAGFLLALVARKKVPEDARLPLTVGAAGGLVFYGLWALLTVAAQPISIKNLGAHSPPTPIGEISEAMSAYLPGIGALALLLTYWALWHVPARIAGGAGAGLVLLVQLLALLGVGGDDPIPLLLQLAFALGWLGLLIASVLPLVRSDDAHPAWRPGGPAA